MYATLLEPRDTDRIRRLLESDVAGNLFQLGILERQGLRGSGAWLGAIDRQDTLIAVTYLGPPTPGSECASTAVPTGDPAACVDLGILAHKMGGTCMIVGHREPADALWEGLGYQPSRVNFEQRLYVCDQPPPGAWLPLRTVREDEMGRVAAMGAQMLAEDLHLDPRRIRTDIHLARTRERARHGRILVVEQSDQLVFKIDLGERSTHGVQVGGTFVPVRWRKRGIATRAMRGLCRLLLDQTPRVTLHVNEANTGAVRCYESSGFVKSAPFRLLSI